LFEADNALRIAQDAGADKYAPEIISQARLDLKNASDIDSSKHGDQKMEITNAREAVERAEDARIASLRKQAAEQQANTVMEKDAAQQQAEQAQTQAAQAQASKERADAAREQAEAQAAQAQANAAEANKNAQDANAVREKLREQLNSVLATTETARGLIVNMSDVLFTTGQYTLKPATKISLAKVAGILLAYPGLSVQVEGYTDSVGSDTYNQTLSDKRAETVKNFLVAQGVSPDKISSEGFGKNDPVADNSTATGRSQNRRVNMVVSGDAIGISEGSSASLTSHGQQPQ
jgi:outer membrane protein OmpA-like peptidoglycan-associated protein